MRPKLVTFNQHRPQHTSRKELPLLRDLRSGVSKLMSAWLAAWRGSTERFWGAAVSCSATVGPCTQAERVRLQPQQH